MISPFERPDKGSRQALKRCPERPYRLYCVGGEKVNLVSDRRLVEGLKIPHTQLWLHVKIFRSGISRRGDTKTREDQPGHLSQLDRNCPKSCQNGLTAWILDSRPCFYPPPMPCGFPCASPNPCFNRSERRRCKEHLLIVRAVNIKAVVGCRIESHGMLYDLWSISGARWIPWRGPLQDGEMINSRVSPVRYSISPSSTINYYQTLTQVDTDKTVYLIHTVRREPDYQDNHL
ncbi:hypothetical protein BR93DRAFT_627941 [Coniochaeta sp. PMI_546]|nr:hypothetical protein BR93DRAFT_627941 [Coniochaeta sp. PMI_546]